MLTQQICTNVFSLPKRLVLIGFRGTGKSTLAAELASRLHLQCISTDACIEHRTGASIAAIVQTYGWQEFRRIETDVIRALPTHNVIIDCGGGVVEREENMELLRHNSCIIWVDATIEDIIQRLVVKADADENAHRPLLSGAATMADDLRLNYARRRALYERCHNVYINTSHESMNAVCEKILANFAK